MKRCLLFLVIFLASLCTLAQEYLGKAKLPRIQETGYYKIDIEPGVSKHLGSGFNNLRIVDDNDQHIPYLLEAENEIRKEEFRDYSFEKQVILNCCTRILIANQEQRTINNIHIRFKNADVMKTAVLSGSDDKNNWFALKDKFTLHTVKNSHSTSEVTVLDFPLANYKYYKLIIDDSTSAPLNLVSVGYYLESRALEKYHSLRDFTFSVRDSLKRKETYVHISFPSAEWVDEVRVKGRNNSPYFRNMTYGHLTQHTGKKRKGSSYQQFGESEISHDAESRMPFNFRKVKDILIVIYNADNSSIKEFDIEVRQTQRTAIAWLEKDKIYSLAVGDEKLLAPEYDVTHFKDRIPSGIRILSPEAMIFHKPFEKQTIGNENLLENRFLLWGAVVGIMAILSLMSFRIVREVRERK